MDNKQDRIDELNKKIDALVYKNNKQLVELNAIRKEVKAFKESSLPYVQSDSILKEAIPSKAEYETQLSEPEFIEVENYQPKPTSKNSLDSYLDKFKNNFNFEKFIGENLINKIGILIIIIGVVVGAKYSIEHNLVSPLTRIILGYISGIALLAFGIKLKSNYINYSAVLVSGAIAILYVITYLAHSFYDLIPMEASYGLMLLFTAFSVLAALKYEKQVIAHIGLIGAYAIPFLLGNEDGNATILFSYVALINSGILAISFFKYWKSILYSSFLFTWMIYGFWFFLSYESEANFEISLLFLGLFFIIFYLAFLGYKLLKKETFQWPDIVLLISNSFLFFGFGYTLLHAHKMSAEYLGLFTLLNAIIHFTVSLIVYKYKLANKNLFYLIVGLVLVFATMAVPIQLDGNWVTLIWAAWAVLLFWIGRTKNTAFYEYLSYPIMLGAFLSIIHDWDSIYELKSYVYLNTDNPDRFTIKPFFNIHILSGLLFVTAFGIINYIHNNKTFKAPVLKPQILAALVNLLIPSIFIFSLYNIFRLEIDNYWELQFWDSTISTTNDYNDVIEKRNYSLRRFKTIWVINYSLAFAALFAFINQFKFKSQSLALANIFILIIAMLSFLTIGLYAFIELRESYLNKTDYSIFTTSSYYIFIRYISYAFFALASFSLYKILNSGLLTTDKKDYFGRNSKKYFELLFWGAVIWITSFELINILELLNIQNSNKLGLTILWGSFSLLLISYGIWKNKKYIRIGSLALFAVTLCKLFFYDISHLSTISKTVVFLSLGVLLLTISFLYNKYKDKIINEDEVL